MGTEVERKFIVLNNKYDSRIDARRTEALEQGYITLSSDCSVRVRMSESTSGGKDSASLTLKGRDRNGERVEFYYRVPAGDEIKQIHDQLCSSGKEKIRFAADLTADAAANTEMTNQADLSRDCTVRVRISQNKASGATRAQLCIKGPRAKDKEVIDRPEFEYDIPVEHARLILDQICSHSISKTRKYLKRNDAQSDPHVEWTIDEYDDSRFGGLKLAEVELKDTNLPPESIHKVKLPDFIAIKRPGKSDQMLEVTNTKGFTNSELGRLPADKVASYVLNALEQARKMVGKAVA
ncbi:MAG: hypothetical protein SFX19_07090 [Alphaproteobacteria bacterium]|nr:hypothetical protein [Alphaproteobacteria bacterium]